jgi:hypothetical protein
MENADQQIILEHGVWVFHTRQSLPASLTDDMLKRIREERDIVNLGNAE